MATKETQAARPLAKGGALIDRGSFEPPYHQLADILRREIASGSLRPGDRVLSEVQLCERYAVSPMTVRRAINILLDEGLIVTSKGRGTFVRPMGLDTAAFGLQALQELFSSDRTDVRIVSARTIGATPRISRKLGIPASTKVVLIRRLIVAGGEPVIYHREYLVYDAGRPLIEAELAITNLRGLFDGQSETVLKRGELRLEVTAIKDGESILLNVPSGTPAFDIEHTFFDFDDRAVSWGWFIIRGDCLSFQTTVGVPSLNG